MLNALLSCKIGRLRYTATCLFMILGFMPWIERMMHIATLENGAMDILMIERIILLVTPIFFFMALVFASMARLRDTRLPEWLAAGLALPVVNAIFPFVFAMIPGTGSAGSRGLAIFPISMYFLGKRR